MFARSFDCMPFTTPGSSAGVASWRSVDLSPRLMSGLIQRAQPTVSISSASATSSARQKPTTVPG